MNPHIEFESGKGKNNGGDADELRFVLSGVNVSLANAIRRTILSDIPTVVFKTTPYELNKSKFIVNTTRQNNEILKQRLSCVPIHITDLEMPLQNYILEVNVENLTDTIQYVTTKDFKIKNVQTGDFLSEKDNLAIFPSNDTTGYFIDFARLRPKISDEIPGEKLQFTCEFSIGTAKEDAMFNVVSTCSYGFTVDDVAVENELSKKVKKWKEDKEDAEVEFEKKNWLLLEAKRIVKPDSFDFTIQSVGVISNIDLVNKACSILVDKLKKIADLMDHDDLSIEPAENTMKNSYDIILVNEDYTIGKVLEYMLYAKFFEGVKILSYCGFKKMHPHDTQSIIRVAYKEKESAEPEVIKQHLHQCIIDAVGVFEKIAEKF